ncbi:MAG: hypothetical protein JWL69_518 [Phycisphaerales bacterium]|nr:hypothetical protein [Phycisphaerales bacterium]
MEEDASPIQFSICSLQSLSARLQTAKCKLQSENWSKAPLIGDVVFSTQIKTPGIRKMPGAGYGVPTRGF